MQVVQQGNQNATNMLDVHEIMLPERMGGMAGFMRQREKKELTAYEPNDFRIITPTDIEFFKREGNNFIAVDGEWEVRLDKRHNAVGQLALGVDPELLKPTFLGGRYFLVDDQIVDFRQAENIKFEHNEVAMMNLVKSVGMSVDQKGKIYAQSITSKFEYEAFGSEGGAFNIDQGFKWSPFSLDIQAALEMLRLACYNGLVVSDPVMNHKIPVMNGWEENLAIANDVIRHAFDHKVGPRIAALPNEMISMHDAMGLADLIGACVHGNVKKDVVYSHNDLAAIYEKLEPLVTPEVRAMQKNVLKFIPVPITAFDAMNVATECASHYLDPFSQQATKLSGFANNLLFSETRQKNLDVNLDSLVMDTKVFSCADQAFHGVTCH